MAISAILVASLHQTHKNIFQKHHQKKRKQQSHRPGINKVFGMVNHWNHTVHEGYAP